MGCVFSVFFHLIKKETMKSFTILFLCIIPMLSFTQPSVKIYAYSQVSTPGTVPSVPSEGGTGNEKYSVQPGAIYYIYATLSPNVRISVVEVWIHGKHYQVSVEKILKTPVYSINNDHPTQPKTEVLVPATKQQVLYIAPLGEGTDKRLKASWFNKMLKSSELIVSYLYKGKKYFIPVKKIKKLQPVAGV
jgi:hypothetical protein